MTRESGPGVLRVRFGITEAEKGTLVLDNITALHTGTLLISRVKKPSPEPKVLSGKSRLR